MLLEFLSCELNKPLFFINYPASGFVVSRENGLKAKFPSYTTEICRQISLYSFLLKACPSLGPLGQPRKGRS
jgi:hypothetical protein